MWNTIYCYIISTFISLRYDGRNFPSANLSYENFTRLFASLPFRDCQNIVFNFEIHRFLSPLSFAYCVFLPIFPLVM